MNKDPIAVFQKKHIDRIVFLVVILGVAVILLITGIVVIRKKAMELKNERTERVQVMTDLNAIAQLTDGKKEADTLIPALHAALPDDLDVPVSVIPHIKSLAAARGLKVEFNLLEGETVAFSGFTGLNFSLRAEGSLTGISNFMADIEGAKNIMSIADWNISRANSGAIDLTVNGLVYIRNNE